MSGIYTIDDFVKRVQDGFYSVEPVFAELRATANVPHTTSSGTGFIAWSYTVPSMPSGVGAFIPARIDTAVNSGYLIYCKVVDLGSLNISTNVFTDGSQMPTVTELGVSRQIGGAVWMEVDVALNATPGTLTFTYKDQDGNGAEVSPSVTLTASASTRYGAFMPLNAGDTGVVDITTAARAAGTTPTGTLHFYGCIPITQYIGLPGNSYSPMSSSMLGVDLNPVRLAAGDQLRLLQMMVPSTHALYAQASFVGDTT